MKRYGNFLLKEDEIGLLSDIVPEEYAQRNQEKMDPKYATIFLQNQLHELMNSFLNGGFSTAGFMLYPTIQGLSYENKGKLQLLKKVMEQIDKKGFDKTLELYRTKSGSELCASVISQLSKDLAALYPKKGRKKVSLKQCKNVDLSCYQDGKTRKDIQKLEEYAQARLKKYLLGFYLHGSLATNDYIKGWSDCDTLAIISKHAVDDPALLLELRQKLYAARQYYLRIDPLQHHGAIIICEYELRNYCEAHFPLEVFKYARSFFDNAPREIYVRERAGEQLKAFFWFVNYFRMLNEAKSYNSYEVKNMLHASTLFPTLYLQARGVHLYKKFSFERAKKGFSGKEWDIINRISAIRKQWEGYVVLPFITMLARQNPILAYQLNVRIVDKFGHVKKTNNLPLKKIITDMRALYEAGWLTIKKEHSK